MATNVVNFVLDYYFLKLCASQITSSSMI